MTKIRMARATLVAFLLLAAITATGANGLAPVYATVLSFSSSSTQSTVIVVLSNHNNNGGVAGDLTLVVLQANGVPRTWVVKNIPIFAGNTTRRVIIPAAISGVRSVRVTNVNI